MYQGGSTGLSSSASRQSGALSSLSSYQRYVNPRFRPVVMNAEKELTSKQTKGIPLEEIAKIFGETEDVQVYTHDIPLNGKEEDSSANHIEQQGREIGV